VWSQRKGLWEGRWEGDGQERNIDRGQNEELGFGLLFVFLDEG
jgi:hypothetical protein